MTTTALIPDTPAPAPAPASALYPAPAPSSAVATALAPAVREDPGPPDFTLAPGRADMWLVRRPTGEAAEALAREELDERERERAAAFIRPADGILYAAAHVALRRIIARYTANAPQDVRFMREPCPDCGGSHGRPAVAPPPPPLHFSLSHSGGIALVGVASVPLGVDVEKLPGAETIEICSRALHPEEQEELAAAEPGEARRELFGRIWTRKEAYLKGLGTGLSRPPSEDYVGTDTGRHPEGWTMVGIPCDPTHAAAAAVRGPAPGVVDVRWVPDAWLSSGPGTGDAVFAPAPDAMTRRRDDVMT
ncbi:4'-phosphopantetheinyl transferase superfamily protein [Streptomyces sp. NPDC089799]|uniref:4'-phosphopantetheinyl transferase family protein n=1 Tax=Streptomyces sp. NPDC089799 TaxID=3155066 RepID=UPI003417F918